MEYILHTKDYKHFVLKSQEDFVEPIEFSDATLAGGCLVGDRVTWDPVAGCRLVDRAEHPVLAGILDLKGKVKYGVTSRGIPLYLFSPHRREYPNFVVGCADRDIHFNKLALVNVDDAVPVGRNLPRANLIEILGNCGDPVKERVALLWAYTPFTMPNNLLAMEPNAMQKRREFELRPSVPGEPFHIDPPECKDVDDVLSIERVGDSWRIWITIADVAEWIEPGGELDIFAKRAGATTYEIGRAARPMLPPAYSEGVLSLVPGGKALGVSLVFEWDGQGIQNCMFLKTVVKTKRTYTYDQANAEKTTTFKVFGDITKFLMGKEDPNAHDIIEAMMILYNREVAMILRSANVGVLRRHEPHDVSKWEKFMALAPSCEPLAYKSAEYCLAESQDIYHAGLKMNAYCTATSPIRRYADLVNQRVLKTFLGMTRQDPVHPDVSIEVMNKRQKELKHYERDLFFITNMFPNERRILKGVLLDWSDLGEGRVSFQVYFPDWKRILKWRTNGTVVGKRVLCVLVHRNVHSQAYLSELQVLNFEISWNPQERHWKDKLLLRLA